MDGQKGNVVPPLAEGRHADGQDPEAVEKVGAEPPRRHLVLEAAVRRGYHADVQGNRPCAADPRDFFLLDDAQETRLRRRGHLPDLVQEERPPVGPLEASRPDTASVNPPFSAPNSSDSSRDSGSAPQFTAT